MTDKSLSQPVRDKQSPTKRDELQTFVFLTVILAPMLAFAVVGGYGLVIWISQLMFGPPGS